MVRYGEKNSIVIWDLCYRADILDINFINKIAIEIYSDRKKNHTKDEEQSIICLVRLTMTKVLYVLPFVAFVID